MAPGVRDAARGLTTRFVATWLATAACAQAPATESSEEARRIVDAILGRHHGTLRGTFDNTILQLRQEPDAPATKIVVAFPHRMRVDHPGKRVDLLVEGVGWKCAGDEPAARITGNELKELRDLMHHLRAVLLIPLYRAERAEMMGPSVIRLIMPGGETWRLQVDQSNGDPEELRGPAGAVRFLSFLNTKVTRMPKKIALPGRGVCYAEFLASDLYLDKAIFADPFLRIEEASRDAKPGTMIKAVRPTQELPRHPELQDIAERTYLARADPGSWKQRFAQINASAEILIDRGQMANGLPTFSIDADRRRLLIPFCPDPEQGHRPFVPGKGDVVLHESIHRAVVVSPPPGTWESVLATGDEMLTDFLAERNLVRAGPLRCIPFLAPDEPPSATQLRQLLVRLEQPVSDGSGR